MSAKVISRTNLGCRVVRTEDETGEHLVLSVPKLRALGDEQSAAEIEGRDAEQFFLEEQCPSDKALRS